MNSLMSIAEGFPLPAHPSHGIVDSTKLKAFLSCPRSFFYEYILGWRPDRPNSHFVFGEAWHQALEHLLLDGTYSDEAVLAAHSVFLTEFRKTFPDPLQDELFFPKTADRAARLLAMYAGRHASDAREWTLLHTEVAGTVPVTDTLWMNFRLDAIVRERESGKILGVEHKTASPWASSVDPWQLDIQPNLYLHALNVYFGQEDVRGVLMNITEISRNKGTKGGTLGDFSRRLVQKSSGQTAAFFSDLELHLENLERNYRLLAEASPSDVSLKAFPRNPGACGNYRGCPLHDFCMAWANPLQRCGQPPLGWTVFRWDPSDRPAKLTLTP